MFSWDALVSVYLRPVSSFPLRTQELITRLDCELFLWVALGFVSSFCWLSTCCTPTTCSSSTAPRALENQEIILIVSHISNIIQSTHSFNIFNKIWFESDEVFRTSDQEENSHPPGLQSPWHTSLSSGLRWLLQYRSSTFWFFPSNLLCLMQ